MKAKTIARRSLQILGGLVILFSLIFLSLLVRYRIGRENPEDYLPDGATAYLFIDSFRDFYDSVIDLKALEIVLSSDEWNHFYQPVLDFKNNNYSKSFLFRQLLKLKGELVVSDGFSPALIIDPGWKGMFNPFIPSFLGKMRSEKLSIGISEFRGETLYTLTYDGDSQYHILFRKNLILLSLKKEDLGSILDARERGSGTALVNRLKKEGGDSLDHSLLDLYFDPCVIKSVFPVLDGFVDFPSWSHVSLFITSDQVALKGTSPLSAKSDQVREFLGGEASVPGFISLLPDTVNIYSSVNFSSFQDFYKIITSGEDSFSLEDYDRLISFLSGMTSREILFSWTGSEAGFFTVENAPEPVVFVKIADEVILNSVLTSLHNSIVLNISDSLVIDNVRISRFEYSGIAGAGMTIAGRSKELPYFIRSKGYLFLSMNPEILARMVGKEKRSELLVGERTYKTITARFAQNANFFFYYDLNSAMPRFLEDSPLLAALLMEYEIGVVTVNYDGNSVTVNLSAGSAEGTRTTLFPGYPKKLEKPLRQLIAADVTGGDTVELISVDEENVLRISDLADRMLNSRRFSRRGNLSLLPGKRILFNDEDGGLYLLDGQAGPVSPFPRFTDSDNSFPPVPTDRGFILFSDISREIQHYSSSGTLLERITVPRTVFSPPLLVEDRIYYYPKTLSGTVYCTTLAGDPVDGWPRSAQGISFSTPFLLGKDIGFLTQKGDLFLWDKEGKIREGFPLSLQGVFYATPAVLDGPRPLAAAVDSEGRVSLVDASGKIEVSEIYGRFAGKDTKVKVENSMIFLYGGSNYITALDRDLGELPGFPVKGYTEPYFADINNDGTMEMITAGYDSQLYIYTLRTGR